jgi:hypothetical protein
MLQNLDFRLKSSLEMSLSNCIDLSLSPVFLNNNNLKAIREATFWFLIFELNHILNFINKNFPDKIKNYDYLSGCNSIVELITKMRNGVSHSNSGEKLLDKENIIIASFNIAKGKGCKLISTDNEQVVCELDDILINYGKLNIYFDYHIKGVIQESINILNKEIDNFRIFPQTIKTF